MNNSIKARKMTEAGSLGGDTEKYEENYSKSFPPPPPRPIKYIHILHLFKGW